MPNIAIPTPDGSFFGLKFHQVAIYHKDPELAVEFWSDAGYNDWHADTAVLVGTEFGEESKKTARMYFNYDIMPLELEYVRYGSHSRNSQDLRNGEPPFLSHYSTYVEDVEYEVDRIQFQLSMEPYHRFVTQDHTNPGVVGVKRFKEAIYPTTRFLGHDVKLIQRVPWDYVSNGV
jgi:hypothetical protein